MSSPPCTDPVDKLKVAPSITYSYRLSNLWCPAEKHMHLSNCELFEAIFQSVTTISADIFIIPAVMLTAMILINTVVLADMD